MTGKIMWAQAGKPKDNGDVWYYYQVQTPSGKIGNYSSKLIFNVGDIVEFEVSVNRENRLSISATNTVKPKA